MPNLVNERGGAWWLNPARRNLGRRPDSPFSPNSFLVVLLVAVYLLSKSVKNVQEGIVVLINPTLAIIIQPTQSILKNQLWFLTKLFNASHSFTHETTKKQTLGVPVQAEAPPSELALAVTQHFEAMEVDKDEVIGGFLSRLSTMIINHTINVSLRTSNLKLKKKIIRFLFLFVLY